MKFNKEHKVIIDTLRPFEATAFIKFLQSEIVRHYDDIKQAKLLIKEVKRQNKPIPKWEI